MGTQGKTGGSRVVAQLKLNSRETDDPRFVSSIRGLIVGSLLEYRPQEVFIVHIDNWFGDKWLGFAGKAVLGYAAAHDTEKVRIPPFIPSRVCSEQYYCWNKQRSCYASTAVNEPLHRDQWSIENVLQPDSLIQAVSNRPCSCGTAGIPSAIPMGASWFTSALLKASALGTRFSKRTKGGK